MQFIKTPSDTFLEKMLLGQLIYAGNTGNKELDKIMSFIENVVPAIDFEKHFFDPMYQKTYHAIYLNYSKQRPLSVNGLSLILSSDPLFANDQNAIKIYLEGILMDACLFSQVEELSKQILDLSLKRQLLNISNTISLNISKDKDAMTSTEYFEEIEKQLANLVIHNEYNKDSQKINVIVDNTLNTIKFNMHNKGDLIGLTTGFTQLNKMLGGLQKNDLIILAARPAMGKTSFALSLALNIAEYIENKKENKNENKIIHDKLGSVVFVSLEMSSEQLVTRLISMKSEINSMKIIHGNLNEEEFLKINLAINNLRDLDFIIDDNAAISLFQLKSKLRRISLKNKISVIFIDYLQLLHGNKKSSEGNRVNEISEISRGLKQIAKEMNVPVIALSQLSRDVEKRQDKTPRLSDLRESGSIEQDADIVLFLHREDYYSKMERTQNLSQETEEVDNDCGKASIIIAKHRNGPVGNISLIFDHDTTSFIDPNKYSIDDEEF